jgi:hypothetical protein
MSSSVQARPTAQEFLAEVNALLQPAGISPIQAPHTGTNLKNEKELARWCEQHWQWAAQWLYDRDTLPSQIEKQWGKNKLARDVRDIVGKYRDDLDAGLDAVLALLDPSGFGSQRPTFQIDKQSVDFGNLAAGATSQISIKLTNGGRRFTRVQMPPLPGWLLSDNASLSIPPGQSRTVMLTADMSRTQVGGIMHAQATFGNGSMTASIQIQALVSRWRTLLASNRDQIVWIIMAGVVLTLAVVGFILGGNAETAQALMPLVTIICSTSVAAVGAFFGSRLSPAPDKVMGIVLGIWIGLGVGAAIAALINSRVESRIAYEIFSFDVAFAYGIIGGILGGFLTRVTYHPLLRYINKLAGV